MNIVRLALVMVITAIVAAPLAAQDDRTDTSPNSGSISAVPGWNYAEASAATGPFSPKTVAALTSHQYGTGWDARGPGHVVGAPEAGHGGAGNAAEDLVTTAPEPATMGLLAIGLVLLAAIPAIRRNLPTNW